MQGLPWFSLYFSHPEKGLAPPGFCGLGLIPPAWSPCPAASGSWPCSPCVAAFGPGLRLAPGPGSGRGRGPSPGARSGLDVCRFCRMAWSRGRGQVDRCDSGQGLMPGRCLRVVLGPLRASSLGRLGRKRRAVAGAAGHGRLDPAGLVSMPCRPGAVVLFVLSGGLQSWAPAAPQADAGRLPGAA
jgi:hypothetical protein